MKKTKVLILALTMVTLIGCSQSNKGKANVELQTIELNYSPITIEKINEGQPKEEWVKGKSIYFGDLPNQVETTIHLYLENIEDAKERSAGSIHAFLEHDNRLYEIGNVGNYGLQNVQVYLEDMNFDGLKEVVISGGMGSNYVATMVIEYNHKNQEWLNILTIANLQLADLDYNGQEELVSISYGSLPGRVELYRWNEDKFEKVNIAEATGNNYAYLHNNKGKWFFESGIFENGNTTKTHFYRYESGRLIELERME